MARRNWLWKLARGNGRLEKPRRHAVPQHWQRLQRRRRQPAEIAELVEEAVLAEFEKIAERGGVLGAMETGYQRGKIQDESMHYEMQKHTGELPLIGVNTFLNKNGSPTILPTEVIRSTKEEKEQQITNLQTFWKRNEHKSAEMLQRLKQVAINNSNLFEELMETVKYCSLGQITNALYEVGGQYRRNM